MTRTLCVDCWEHLCTECQDRLVGGPERLRVRYELTEPIVVTRSEYLAKASEFHKHPRVHVLDDDTRELRMVIRNVVPPLDE